MRRSRDEIPAFFTILAWRRGYDEDSEVEPFVVGTRAWVTPEKPGRTSGPVDACYPTEAAMVDYENLAVYCGPSPRHVLNPLAMTFTEYNEWFHGEQLEDAAFVEAGVDR